MRRLLGLKSKSSKQPLDSLSPNTDERPGRTPDGRVAASSTATAAANGSTSHKPRVQYDEKRSIGIVDFGDGEQTIKSKQVHYDRPTASAAFLGAGAAKHQPTSMGAAEALDPRASQQELLPPPVPIKDERTRANSTIRAASHPRASLGSKTTLAPTAAPTTSSGGDPSVVSTATAHASNSSSGVNTPRPSTSTIATTLAGYQSPLQRTTSPLSFSPSTVTSHLSMRSNPYVGSMGGGGQWANQERDPTGIYAPATWSEFANPELVDNVSARERTRQEILWEVVASEERYVFELRSLVNLYVAPLLHPLLSNPVIPPPSSPPTPAPPTPSPTPYQNSIGAAASNSELPIAARFSRSLYNVSTDTLARPTSGLGHGLGVVSWNESREAIPDMSSNERDASDGSSVSTQRPNPSRSRMSLPVPSRVGSSSSTYASIGAASSATLNDVDEDPLTTKLRSKGKRLSSFTFRSAMASMRNVSSSSPSFSAEATHGGLMMADGPPFLLPVALRMTLEAVVEMLRGHELLAQSLKEQWAKAFPLVRGLAAIWSDQPWFLETYAQYVLSLEEALSTIDSCIPSGHSPHLSHNTNGNTGAGSVTAKFLKRASSLPTHDDKNLQRLTKTLLGLEEKAAEAGESGLGLCLSKPLMRLSKLPLLMQALLFHTDPTTHEWEKTRAMALEVDELVRSIEDEKIEEEERAIARDALARIDGIKDKELVAPRSARVLIEEIPVPRESISTPRPTKEGVGSGILGRKGSKSKLGGGRDKKGREEWFVKFSDVTIRCVKVRETDLPSGFGFGKKGAEGKQAKRLKKGKVRNVYRFVRVEKWETPEDAEAKLAEWLGRPGRAETELMVEEMEDEMDDLESHMSFRYDADDPRPASPRVFRASSLPNTPGGARKGSRLSTTTQSVVAKQSPAVQKHGQRLRVTSEALPRLTSPSSRQRFETPTAASQARATSAATLGNGRPSTTTSRSSVLPARRAASAQASATSPRGPAIKGASSSSSSNSAAKKSTASAKADSKGLTVPLSESSSSVVNGLQARDQSTLGLYDRFWSADERGAEST